MAYARRVENAQLVAGVFGHAVGRPGRDHHDLDLDVADAFERAEHGLRLRDQLRAGRAGGLVIVISILTFGLVLGLLARRPGRPAQVDDVDEQLGIDDLLERFANAFLR